MLRAIYHGEDKDHRITSIKLTEDQWRLLQQETNPKGKKDKSYKKVLSSPITNNPLHLQTSKNGLRYFALYRRTPEDMEGYGEPETWHHIEIKDAIVRAATALGYKAMPEITRGEALSKTRTDVEPTDHSWIADVLIQRPNHDRPLAIEVQWSRQTTAEFKRRQDRYEKDGVDCIWLYRYADVNTTNISKNQKTGELLDHNGVPIFKLYEKTMNRQHYAWMPWNRKGTIREWTTLVLNENICTHQPLTPTQILGDTMKIIWANDYDQCKKRFLYGSNDYPAIHAEGLTEGETLNFFLTPCGDCGTEQWTWTRASKQGEPLPNSEITVTDSKPEDSLADVRTVDQPFDKTGETHTDAYTMRTTYHCNGLHCCDCGAPLDININIVNRQIVKPEMEGRWLFDFRKRDRRDWSPEKLGLMSAL